MDAIKPDQLGSSISPWSISTNSSNQSGENHEMPSAGPSKPRQANVTDEVDNGADERKTKKQKFLRSRQACLQCRSRKSKCGAHPPDPCPNCLEAKIQCTWPAEDGRSSKSRMQKAQNAFLARGMGSMPPDFLTLASGGAQMDDGWLERFLAAGQVGPSQHVSSPTTSLLGLANAAARTSAPPPLEYPTAQTPFSAFANSLRSPEDPNPRSFQPGPVGSGLPQTAYPQRSGMALPTMPRNASSNLDPTQFIWAVSSQLPQVEESSPYEEGGSATNSTGPSPNVGDPNGTRKGKAKEVNADGSKLVKITWWRPHGATAIAPGLKKITLKVRVTDSAAAFKTSSPHAAFSELDQIAQQVIDPNGMPSPPIMRHLLDVFFVHFGSQFPFLNKVEIDEAVETGTGSAFLLNAIAAVAARFSTHPAIAVPHLQPHAYGDVFNNRARVLLGSMLGVPSRETITAFVLLSHVSFANDCESDLWMLTGCAVRMAYDLGLHLDSSDATDAVSKEDARLNRLVFWSVLIMDHALAFGVGRQTTFRLEDITQQFPEEEDIHPGGLPPDAPRSAFPYAAKQMFSYGPLINMLNSNHANVDPAKLESDIATARATAMVEYNCLPEDIQWNVGNLQRHNRANQSPIFLQLHLWMHLILASAFLTRTNILRKSKYTTQPGARSGAATPNTATAYSLWRNSARTIGDILVLSDIINSYSYLALPFVNQAFYVAGCCYVKEIEQHQSSPVTPAGSPKRVPANLSMTATSPSPSKSPSPTQATKDPRQAALSRALLTSVATNNISTLQQGLAKQTTYWSGVAWVAGALAQRIEGIGAQDVDLVHVTEKLGSYVSLPDAGSVPRISVQSQDQMDHLAAGITPRTWSALMDGSGNGDGLNVFKDDMDFLSLPFELGSIEGGSQNVTEQDVPLRSFGAEWFR